MKRTPEQMINSLNFKLQEYQQLTRLVEWSKDQITLSTGKILKNLDRARFIKRIMNPKTDLWCKNIDRLLNGEVTELEIKSELAALGGKACQDKYGAKIRSNLNSGIPWNKGLKGNYPYKFGPRPQHVKDKISAKNSGKNNGMYGVKMSDADRQMRSDIIRTKILEGKFTPISNNRNTHWNATLDTQKYRSSWESLYQYINPAAEYEKLRLAYEYNGKRLVYIVDFIDYKNKIVVEVKPRELCTGEKFRAKISALTAWAKQHQFSVLIVDKQWLQEQRIHIDYSRFDNKTEKKIKAMYETN